MANLSFFGNEYQRLVKSEFIAYWLYILSHLNTSVQDLSEKRIKCDLNKTSMALQINF